MALYVVEHKTSSEDISAGSNYWKRLVMDPQISVYIEGARSLGYDVKGVLYDVLKKPLFSPKKDEAERDFESRMTQEICAEPDKYYQRALVVRLDRDMKDSASDLWQTTKAIMQAKRDNAWPRNPDACIQWSRTCDYFDICAGEADPEDSSKYKRLESAHTELSEIVADDEVFSQSSIRTFRSCHRKYQLRYEQKIRKLIEPSTLVTGRVLHEALERWWGKEGNLVDSLSELTSPRDRAMMIGYHIRWSKPPRVIAVEKEFRMDLFDPADPNQGNKVNIAGKIDAICEIENEL